MLLFALLAFRATNAQEIRVAAAADLKFALDELDAQYQKQTGRKIDVSYGSSGNFFAQIQNCAPFDLLVSADIEYPPKLEAAGLAGPRTLYEYALGRTGLLTPPDPPIHLPELRRKPLLEPANGD